MHDAHPYHCITDLADLDKLVQLVYKAGICAIDTETTGLDARTVDLVGVAITTIVTGEFVSVYIPVGHRCTSLQLDQGDVLARLEGLLASGDVVLVLHNALYDMIVFDRYGLDLVNVHDTMVMSYALDVKRNGLLHNMDACAKRHLDKRTVKFGEVVHNQSAWLPMDNFADVPLDVATWYAAEDTEITLELFYTLQDKLVQKGQWDIYNSIDRPQLFGLFEMKANGIAVSRDQLNKLELDFQVRIQEIEHKIKKLAPGLEWTSNPKLAAYMFGPKEHGGLDLKVLETTKTGQPSVAAEVMKLYEGQDPVVDLVLEWRGLAKLVSTYLRPIAEKTDWETSRLYADINPAVTATGRYSGSNPNLQNIPQRTPDGTKLRGLFVAPAGRRLVGADYSNIEMRILAHVSQEPKLLKLFREGGDQHADTAFDVFGVQENDDNYKEMRDRAKTLNFATVYGITSIGLSKKFGVTPSEAQDILDRFMDSRPKMRDWINRQSEQAGRGYVETLFGRRLYLGRGYGAERQAVNYVIQGTAADLMRAAIGQVAQCLVEEVPSAQLLLTVHDELIVECDPDDTGKVSEILKHEMEYAAEGWVNWSVPIVVKPDVGQNWKDLK